MERFQNVKAGIANAKNIKLVFPEKPDNDTIGSVLALCSMFKQLNKKVTLPIERLPQKAKQFLAPEKKKITITLNEDVAEIYYEKKEGHVDLNIVPKNDDFDTKNFSWEVVSEKGENKEGQINEPIDLIIILGISRFNEVEKLLPTDEEELFACTIVNIDKNPSNENYGDINIVEQYPLSKTLSFLVKEMKESVFKKELFDFLIFGFFSQGSISVKDISTIKWLVGNKGSLDVYFEYRKEQKPLWAKYLEVAIKNISIKENEEIIFSYLPNENNDDKEWIKNVLQVSKIFREWIIPNAFFISFQENGETKTIFYSSLSSIMNSITKKYKGNFKETGGIIITSKEPKETMEELKELI